MRNRASRRDHIGQLPRLKRVRAGQQNVTAGVSAGAAGDLGARESAHEWRDVGRKFQMPYNERRLRKAFKTLRLARASNGQFHWANGAVGENRTHDLSLTKGLRYHYATTATVASGKLEPNP